MKTLIFTLLLFVSIFSSSVSSALSLGDINISSVLNQSLRASIQVKNTKELREEEIIVRLASEEYFKKSGIEHLHFYKQLKFTVSKTESNDMLIQIRSHDSVVEPFLNFIIEVQTPQGRSFKQYTLLIEPH